MPSNDERSSTNGNSIGTSVTIWFPNIFKIIGVMTAAATSIRSRECFSAAALSAATKRSPAQTKNSGQGVDGRVPSNTADARVSSPIIAVKSSLILSLVNDKNMPLELRSSNISNSFSGDRLKTIPCLTIPVVRMVSCTRRTIPSTACVMISATDPGNRGDVVIHVKNSTIAISINYNWQKYVSRLLSKIASSKVTAPPRADDFYSGVNEALVLMRPDGFEPSSILLAPGP